MKIAIYYVACSLLFFWSVVLSLLVYDMIICWLPFRRKSSPSTGKAPAEGKEQ